MVNTTLNNFLKQSLSVQIQEETPLQDVHKILSLFINELIRQDFNRLIFLLYKIDVSEAKLKQILKEHPHEDAGKIIANLIIERQEQKIALRNSFDKKNESNDEERW
jgi:hypothetical protein